MTVYVVLETCCNHLVAIFKDKVEAQEFMLERGYNENNGYYLEDYDL